jgi:hypothetical protein
MITNDLPLTLTQRDLAKQLRVSVRTIERMRKARKLPPHLPDFGRPRWGTQAIMSWISDRKD